MKNVGIFHYLGVELSLYCLFFDFPSQQVNLCIARRRINQPVTVRRNNKSAFSERAAEGACFFRRRKAPAFDPPRNSIEIYETRRSFNAIRRVRNVVPPWLRDVSEIASVLSTRTRTTLSHAILPRSRQRSRVSTRMWNTRESRIPRPEDSALISEPIQNQMKLRDFYFCWERVRSWISKWVRFI